MTSFSKLPDETTFVEFFYGRYTIKDERYKKVYEEGREIYSLGLVHILRESKPHFLGLAAGIKTYTKKGQSTLTKENTELSIHPLYLGFRYLLKQG